MSDRLSIGIKYRAALLAGEEVEEGGEVAGLGEGFEVAFVQQVGFDVFEAGFQAVVGLFFALG